MSAAPDCHNSIAEMSVAQMIVHVIKGPATLDDIKILANSAADGLGTLRTLKEVAEGRNLTHLLDLLREYETWEKAYWKSSVLSL